MSRAPSGSAPLLHDFRAFAGGRLWLAVALILAGAVAEGFGILMLIPLVTIATGAASPGGDLAAVGNIAASLSPDQRFLVALGLFVLAMSLRSLLIYARDIELARLQAGYEASLRLRAAAGLAGSGWSFASRIGQAGMQSLLLTDVPRAAEGVNYAQSVALAGILIAVQLALTAWLSPEIAGIAVAVLVLGFVVSLRWTRRGAESGFAIVGRNEESASSGFRLHSGLKAALAQGTVAEFLSEYGATLGRATGEYVRFARDLSAARALAALGSGIAAAMLLFIGYRVLDLPFAVLVTLLVLLARMSGPAQQLQQSTQRIAAYAPSFLAIEQRLGRLPEGTPAVSRCEPLDWQELQMRGVRFEHQPGLALRDVSLALSRGEWIGLGGASGAGKTTFVDLVSGLLPPQAGEIGVDGRALEGEVLDRWRAGLAYVGQEGSVFNDSVRGNLLAEGARADDESLWSALRTVGLEQRIRAFPRGLDESVGDRGSQLSGGERQRLVIARALLRRASLLILDEATAALDVEAEREVLARLRALDPRPAAIVVAHRPSTLDHCDSRVTIQHGSVKIDGAGKRADV